MKVEVEFVPVDKNDYKVFLHIMNEMLRQYLKERKAANGKEKLLELHPKNNP